MAVETYYFLVGCQVWYLVQSLCPGFKVCPLEWYMYASPSPEKFSLCSIPYLFGFSSSSCMACSIRILKWWGYASERTCQHLLHHQCDQWRDGASHAILVELVKHCNDSSVHTPPTGVFLHNHVKKRGFYLSNHQNKISK